MHRNRLTFVTSFAFVAATLMLSGCGGASASTDSAEQITEQAPSGTTPDSESASAGSTGAAVSGEAVLSYEGVAYTAELELCSLYGGEEAIFYGPAFDEAGNNVGYFSGDFMGLMNDPSGEARIDFGATKNMESTDEFVALGSPGGHIVISDSSDTSLIVVGATWDQSGAKLPTGTLKVTC